MPFNSPKISKIVFILLSFITDIIALFIAPKLIKLSGCVISFYSFQKVTNEQFEIIKTECANNVNF